MSWIFTFIAAVWLFAKVVEFILMLFPGNEPCRCDRHRDWVRGAIDDHR